MTPCVRCGLVLVEGEAVAAAESDEGRLVFHAACMQVLLEGGAPGQTPAAFLEALEVFTAAPLLVVRAERETQFIRLEEVEE